MAEDVREAEILEIRVSLARDVGLLFGEQWKAPAVASAAILRKTNDIVLFVY